MNNITSCNIMSQSATLCPFTRIDQALRRYYNDHGNMNYDVDGKGKFLSFCVENEFDADDIDEELADVAECGFLDFDKHFPLPTTMQQCTENEKRLEMFRIIQNCHRFGDYHGQQQWLKRAMTLCKKRAIKINQQQQAMFDNPLWIQRMRDKAQHDAAVDNKN